MDGVLDHQTTEAMMDLKTLDNEIRNLADESDLEYPKVATVLHVLAGSMQDGTVTQLAELALEHARRRSVAITQMQSSVEVSLERSAVQ